MKKINTSHIELMAKTSTFLRFFPLQFNASLLFSETGRELPRKTLRWRTAITQVTVVLEHPCPVHFPCSKAHTDSEAVK